MAPEPSVPPAVPRPPRRQALVVRLLLPILAVLLIIGGLTLLLIERTLSSDLTATLEARLRRQGNAVAAWLRSAGHPERLAPRLGAVTSARITIVDGAGIIEGDSSSGDLVGTAIGDAPEVATARAGQVGRATRAVAGRPTYLVAVPVEAGRVVRLAVPLADNLATQRRMRTRLLAGAGVGFGAVVLLSWLVVRRLVRPLQAMTVTAEQLARGDYAARPPAAAAAAGGEVGVLAHALSHLAGEVQARFAEIQGERDLVRGVLSSLVEGVVVLDRDRRVVLVNDAAAALVGAGSGVDLPASLGPLLAGADREERAAEITVRGRAVRATALPLAGAGGTVLVLYDITRLRALEGQSREFLASAAHELRTPVTAISGYAETLLASPGPDPATQREFLTVIHRNAQRIAGLVSDLLVLEGLGARAEVVATGEPVALAPVVADAVDAARAVVSGARFEVDVDPALLVLGNRDGLDHVVQNLVDNAAKYGGDEIVTIRAHRDGARVVLQVRDRGPGIAPEHLVRVFERFYRIDAGRSRQQGGSGLGLAIARSQAEAMGGTLTVTSTPGAGATFELTLTAADVDVGAVG